MSAGHEERFRRLFTEEAAGRLMRLSEAALDLEGCVVRAVSTDPALVEAMLREAHSLKGGAAVVGLEPLAQAVHALEDVIERLRGEAPAPPRLVDGLLGGIDGLRALLAAARDGREHAAQADALVATLRSLSADGARMPAPRPLPVPSSPRVGWSATASDPAVLRVPRSRLDQLPSLVAESAAAHLRLGRALAERDVDAAAPPEFRRLSRLLAELLERTGLGTRFRMVVPLTLTVLPCLPASAEPADPALSELLGLPPARPERVRGGATVVLRGGSAVAVFQVEAVIGQRDVVVKGLSRLLPRVDVVAGAGVEADGAVLVVLDPTGLVARATAPAPASG